MADIIVLAAIGLVVGLAAGHIYKEKKKGNPCIGCPYGGNCSGSCGGCAKK